MSSHLYNPMHVEISSSIDVQCGFCGYLVKAGCLHICPNTLPPEELENRFLRNLREVVGSSPEAAAGYREAELELQRIKDGWPFGTRLYETWHTLVYWWHFGRPNWMRRK